MYNAAKTSALSFFLENVHVRKFLALQDMYIFDAWLEAQKQAGQFWGA